ncbi:MAG: hypothetical protein NC543_10865, partial [bacterium]|nr:hypothetical protein [bacterium]MCM1375870.1 hypothetical protein [Muribaculum sp.]
MKKRKSSLLQRMLAVLLSVSLTLGLIWSAPINVLAQGSVSGNDAEYDWDLGKSEAVSGGGSQAQGSVSGNDVEMTELAVPPQTMQEAAEEDMIMTAADDGTAVPGNITSNQTWNTQTLAAGTYTIPSGVTVTVSGKLTITGNVTMNGGGTLRWSSAGREKNALEVQEGAQLTLENITLDGNRISFSRSALLLQGNVTLNNGTVIKNFKTSGGSGSPAGMKGMIAVYEKGVLNIQDGVTITGNECGSGIIALYQYDTGSSLANSTATVNMYGGTIAGNTVKSAVSDMGVIWNWCGNLNISGGTVTAEGGEYAVHTQGNNKSYNATTVISGGTFTGMKNGAVCAGKDSGNRSVIRITGGSFNGNIAATVNYGTIEIRGGVYSGTQYALSSNGAGALEVYGGEFTGGTKAYDGTINTKTEKVIVGDAKETGANWNRLTSLNTYQYVAIGELEQPLPSHSHNDITFTSWTGTDSLPTMVGNYYLTGDVTMSGTWEAPAGTTGLCLNGYQVKYTGAEEDQSFLQVNENATLNLYDCDGSGGTHTLTSPVTNGSVTVRGGLITGTSQKSKIVGSCICIYPNGTCNLYGGSIAGFSDTPSSGGSHGAVRVEGIFHMYGGAITHNRSGCGGGVNVCGVNAHFYLHGGSISDNYADFDDGGGICINDTGSFEMTGGEIRGNKAKSGAGGIHWYNDGNVTYSVHLSGGEIIGNTTGGAAGGLKFDANPWQQFFVSGGIKITGNKNLNDKDSNLYLGSDSTIMVESGGFSQGALIGVTTESAPMAQTSIAVTGHNKGDYSQYFQSDNPDYEIRNESDTVKLALPHQHTPVKKEKVLADCTNPGTGEYWQCEGTTGCGKMFSDQACTKEISVKPVLPAQGHSYESTWKKDASGHWKVCADCNYRTTAAAHTYDNDSDMSCNDCGWDRTGTDKTPPTGSITIEGKSWDKLSESISFDLFFNEAKQALIQGQDTAGDVCSGVDKVYYYVSDTALSGEAVKALGSSQWKEGTSITLEAADWKCIIYVKITDKAGNAAYVSSGGLVFDVTAPEIGGVTDGAVYRSSQTVTVTDTNLKTVTVNGAEVTLTDNSFTLEAASGRQTITAEDKAGNRSTVTAVVKTAAENVNDAKQVIEAALEEIFSGNHTTGEDVRRAVEAALEKAGISGEDVQITLKD